MKLRKSVQSIAFIFAWLMISQTVFSAPASGGFITLQTASEQSFNAYSAGPEDAKKRIMLIHGWYGVTDVIIAWADEFAKAGYRVMAVDLYNGQTASENKRAEQLMKAVRQNEANEKYAATLKALAGRGNKVAVLGWSFGGSQALHATLAAPDRVDATIIYYPFGELVSDTQRLKAIQGPILGHFVYDDFALKADALEKFQSTIKSSGVAMTTAMYKAGHGFTNSAGKNYSEKASRQSLDRTYRFLDMHLN